jgi:hypothetical protein
MAFVDKEFIATLVGGKEQFWQSVVIQVSARYAATIIEIPICKYVIIPGFCERIREGNLAVIDNRK